MINDFIFQSNLPETSKIDSTVTYKLFVNGSVLNPIMPMVPIFCNISLLYKSKKECFTAFSRGAEYWTYFCATHIKSVLRSNSFWGYLETVSNRCYWLKSSNPKFWLKWGASKLIQNANLIFIFQMFITLVASHKSLRNYFAT